jgi:hypothetical protein
MRDVFKLIDLKSFIARYKSDVQDLNEATLCLLNLSSIRVFRNDPRSGVVILAPTHYWAKLEPDGEVAQAKTILQSDELFNRLDLLFEGKPQTITDKYNNLKNYFVHTIRRTTTNWSVPATINEAKAKLKMNSDELKSLLDWLESLGCNDILIIPDTNALIINHKIETYGGLVGDIERWTVIVTSTVLKELDELKVKSNNHEFREKVKKTINYLKGLRNQGDIINGLTLYKDTVTIKMIPVEPNMDKTLPWLDKDNNDDRIIASCFDIQIRNPASSVILMTADINLQTKAQLARLPILEPEPIEY